MEKIKKLEEFAKEEAKELRVHTAGGITKLAYRLVKEGNEAETLTHFCTVVAQDIVKTLDIPWAYLVLKHSKGIKYPIVNATVLKERLKGIDADEVVEKLHYPIKNPANLLHEIKMVINA